MDRQTDRYREMRDRQKERVTVTKTEEGRETGTHYTLNHLSEPGKTGALDLEKMDTDMETFTKWTLGLMDTG